MTFLACFCGYVGEPETTTCPQCGRSTLPRQDPNWACPSCDTRASAGEPHACALAEHIGLGGNPCRCCSRCSDRCTAAALDSHPSDL